MKRHLLAGFATGLGLMAAIMLVVSVAVAADIFSVDADGTVRLRIASNGNVGVGTSANPGSRLEVRGSGTTSSTSALNVTNGAGNSRHFVRDDGRVGVGTNSPGATLDVAGNMQMNDGAFRSVGQYNLTSGATLYIPDGDIPREGIIILSFSADASPGSVILQIYRNGTYNDACKMVGSNNWCFAAWGTWSEPTATNWRIWIENNNAGARLVVKNIESYGRTFRIYSLGY